MLLVREVGVSELKDPFTAVSELALEFDCQSVVNISTAYQFVIGQPEIESATTNNIYFDQNASPKLSTKLKVRVSYYCAN